MAPIQLTDGERSLVADLVRFLGETKRLTKRDLAAIEDAKWAKRFAEMDEMDRLAKEHGKPAALQIMLERARGIPDFPTDSTSPRATLQPRDNDISYHCYLVREAIGYYRETGATPPPYYARRIAIILRKAHAYELEAAFLAQCVKFFGDPAFVERREKALALAAKRSK